MAHEPHDRSMFEDALDIPQWLEKDRDTPFAERVRRDRGIARELEASDGPRSGRTGTPYRLARVRAWWDQAGREAAPGPGHRFAALRRLTSIILAVIGILGGCGVAVGAFHYNGSEPVNVVKVLALLVGFQTVLLILTLVLLPGRVPGLRHLQDAIASINIGAFAAAVYRRFARPAPSLAPLFAWHAGRASSANRLAKWQLLQWAQIAAVAFNVAALVTATALITFTDLAFGWSTTLTVHPETVARIVHATAWPWHTFIPGAVPDLELISRSQFFRLENVRAFDAAASRELTGWWSFTVLAIVFYGLLPRTILLLFARSRRAAAEKALLLDDPRVGALLERMSAPAIETSVSAPASTEVDALPPDATQPINVEGRAAGVIWSHALDPAAASRYALAHLGLELISTVDAGGALDLADDLETIGAVSRTGEHTVVIFTPAWEPPVLEFLDFVAALRESLGPAATLLVTPVSEQASMVDPGGKAIWARALDRLVDPQIHVETGTA